MSDVHSGARHVDPLDALRAADHRPIADVWRQRLATWLRDRASRGLATRGLWLVGAAALTAIVWQLFVASEPPVEESIPLAEALVVQPPQAPEPVGPTTGEPSTTDVRPEPPATVVVHVAGAVRSPGLVDGASGWRIDDAVHAAGGATAVADLDRLNLAALVEDGQRIFVPSIGETEPAVVQPTGGTSNAGGPIVDGPTVIDINSADQAELETLPGVGPATAATIVAHRGEHGNFADVEALIAVRGIGPATLDALREHIRAD